MLITLDPTSESPAGDRADRPGPAAALRSLDGIRLGLLANGKSNSMAILDAVRAELTTLGLRVAGEPVRITKASVSVPPTPEAFDRLVADTDAVLVAIGD